MDEIVWYDHLYERRLLSSTFLWYYLLYAVQCGSNFCVWGWNPIVWPFKWKLLTVVLFIMLYTRCFVLSCMWMKSYSQVWPFNCDLFSSTLARHNLLLGFDWVKFATSIEFKFKPLVHDRVKPFLRMSDIYSIPGYQTQNPSKLEDSRLDYKFYKDVDFSALWTLQQV